MKTMKKLFGILLALSMILALSAPVSASKITDAHGNEIELDDSLEAYTETELFGADDAARKGETNLGDLWTDALRWFVVSGKIDEYYEEDDVTAGNNKLAVDADHVVALWNGGNLRADLSGKFVAEDLVKVLPYPNTVAVVYMTGAQLREALEAAAQGLPYSEETAAACASFMQVSGMKYTVNTAKAFDKGEEYKAPWFKAASVQRVTIGEVNGQPLDETATYAVVTSNANFNGMDSSYVFKAAAAANEKSVITTAVVRDVVWMYLDEKLENVVREADYGKPQGRITVAAVQPTPQKLTVNGAEKSTEIYNIDGSNYFKLRDMAALLSGTGSQFNVEYDKTSNTVVVTTGKAYEKQDGDLTLGADKSASAVRSAQKITIDGTEVADLTAYNLAGNNFFKLRELGEKLGFGVEYDQPTDTVIVTSK